MTKNLTEGDPARLIFFFALPLVAGNMMQQLYSFVDTLIVGRFLGVNALAAVGCTGSLMFLALGDSTKPTILLAVTLGINIALEPVAILALLLVYRNVLQGLGQSVIPTIAGAMELVMRAGAAIFLCGTLGFLGACLANPLAWIGAAIPVTIAYFWTERTLRHAS